MESNCLRNALHKIRAKTGRWKRRKKSMLGANSMRKNAEIIQIKCEGTRYSKTEHMKKTIM